MGVPERPRSNQTHLVRSEQPITCFDSEPEPDIALIEGRGDFYESAHPTASDTKIIFEVADSSILADRNIKVPLYARAAIPEVWLVNLRDQMIELYFQPLNGSYQQFRSFKRDDVLVSGFVKDLSVSVNDIFG